MTWCPLFLTYCIHNRAQEKCCRCGTLHWQVKQGSSVAKTSLPISAAVQLLRGSKHTHIRTDVTELGDRNNTRCITEWSSVLTCTDRTAGVWTREQDVALRTVDQTGTLLSVTPQVLLSIRHHLGYTQVGLLRYYGTTITTTTTIYYLYYCHYIIWIFHVYFTSIINYSLNK